MIEGHGARVGLAVAVVLVIAIVVVLAAPWRSGGSSPGSHTPLRRTPLRVLPDPPLKPLTFHSDVTSGGTDGITHVEIGPPQYVGDSLSGSPDRLVVARGIPPFASASKRSPLGIAAFDFRTKRWQRLPNARWRPVAVPDGLVGVGIPCARVDAETKRCRIEVSTLHWDDHAWRTTVLRTRAITLPSPDEAEIEFGVYPLGVRDGFAFFRVDRDHDRRILRVDVDGNVTTLPVAPLSKTCVTPDGLDAVQQESVRGAGTRFGPVRHLDDRATHPEWRTVGTGGRLAVPATTTAVCGARGLLFMHPPRTSAWAHERLVTIVGSGTPAPPSYPDTVSALADGGFAYANQFDVRWLRGGRYGALPSFTTPGGDQLLTLTTVGNVIVYQVGLYNTGNTQLRVVP